VSKVQHGRRTHQIDSSQVLTIWGLIGVHTNKIGYKHVWEVWYAIVYLTLLNTG